MTERANLMYPLTAKKSYWGRLTWIRGQARRQSELKQQDYKHDQIQDKIDDKNPEER